MHGELLSARCLSCGQSHRWAEALDHTNECPGCTRSGKLRPDIVWFGEMPLYMDAIYSMLEKCALFIAIGTSGNVYPAAGFHALARDAGAKTVELNLQPSRTASAFDQAIYGPATEVVPAFVSAL